MMRKKINVDELTVGMYLDEVPGSWIDSPFWHSKFVISSAKQIANAKASRVREVWIDTSMGRDVEQPVSQAPNVPFTAVVGNAEPALPAASQVQPSSMADELKIAARICEVSKQALKSMFQDARMGNTVESASVGQLVHEISDSVSRNSGALISLARLKTADDYTYMHSVAVCAMMIALAKQLRLNENDIRAVGVAGLLHDMGKALVPASILNKPGKLTVEEFAIVKRHPELGHELLGRSHNMDPIALDVCLHHHEKTDGSGYPLALSDSEISLYAKMGAVCDVYDAITSERPYKAGWDPAEAMRQMGLWAPGHFDQRVFHAFVKCLGIYPVGALVRLGSGLLGIVIEQNKSAITRPRVLAFYCTESGRRIEPQLVDLGGLGCNESIVAREDPVKWNFSDLNELWTEQALA